MSDEQWGDLERVAAPVRTGAAGRQGGAALWLSLSGRISRSTYWLKFLLPMVALFVVAAGIDYSNGFVQGVGPAYGLVSLITLWPGIAGMVKRLHDLGHAGWIVLVIYGGLFLSGVAMAVAIPALGEQALLLGIPVLVLGLVMLWYTIKMLFFRGTFGPNRYGVDPLKA